MVIENVQKQVFDQIIFRFLFHHFVVSVALKSSWSVLQDILTFFSKFCLVSSAIYNLLFESQLERKRLIDDFYTFSFKLSSKIEGNYCFANSTKLSKNFNFEFQNILFQRKK